MGQDPQTTTPVLWCFCFLSYCDFPHNQNIVTIDISFILLLDLCFHTDNSICHLNQRYSGPRWRSDPSLFSHKKEKHLIKGFSYKLFLDPDPEIWSNLDLSRFTQLHYQFLEKNWFLIIQNNGTCRQFDFESSNLCRSESLFLLLILWFRVWNTDPFPQSYLIQMQFGSRSSALF